MFHFRKWISNVPFPKVLTQDLKNTRKSLNELIFVNNCTDALDKRKKKQKITTATAAAVAALPPPQRQPQSLPTSPPTQQQQQQVKNSFIIFIHTTFKTRKKKPVLVHMSDKMFCLIRLFLCLLRLLSQLPKKKFFLNTFFFSKT